MNVNIDNLINTLRTERPKKAYCHLAADCLEKMQKIIRDHQKELKEKQDK